jgi:carbon monoxide dehydrogenase subunit G
MEIRQEFTVAHGIADVWRTLGDVRLVAACMPGAEVVSVSDDQSEVQGRIRAQIGPIGANFNGRAKILRDDQNRSGSLEGTGLDQSNGSRAAVKLIYALRAAAEDPSSTTTTVVATITLSGLLAQFGKGRLINDVATQMTREFASRLQQALVSSVVGAGAAVRAVDAKGDNSLRLTSIAVGLLKEYLRRLFGGFKRNKESS